MLIAIITFLLVLSAVVFVAAIYLGRRNQEVYNYRTSLLAKLGPCAEEDEAAGREWLWRFDYFNSVSYNAMIWKFWKDLDSFYEDYSFITPTVKND